MNKCTKENKDFETFPIKLMIQVAQKAAKERINVSPDQAEKLVIEIQTKAGLILDQETALTLLKFMADSNNQSHQEAALIGLEEMDCLEKIEILWTLLEKFENQHKQQASTHARHQIFSVIEHDHEAVPYLNNLNTRCLSFLDDQDVVHIYPFCPPDTKPDNFARLLALEKINQTTKVSDVVQLDKDHPWKSFFHTLLKEKTASEDKHWQQLPKDKMKRIWRLQWQTLGRLCVAGALIWGMVLLGDWVYNADRMYEYVIFFLCCSSIFPALVWPIFRFVANKMKWFSADGIAIETVSKCLKAVPWRKRSVSLFKTIRMSSS